MSVPTPHFLLYSAAKAPHAAAPARATRVEAPARVEGRWTFTLEAADGSTRLEVADAERGLARQRLELLAVVRGLEALDQPSRVTLLTPSSYVRRGLRFGVRQWRDNDWRWELFGRMVPVRNADLWRRVDRALRIHEVHYRRWRYDPPQRQSRISAHGSREPSRLVQERLESRRSRTDLLSWFERGLAWIKNWLARRSRVSLVCAE